MLAVDRADLPGTCLGHHQLAGRHQALLVRQSEDLARDERRQGGPQAGGSDHRVEHDGRSGGLGDLGRRQGAVDDRRAARRLHTTLGEAEEVDVELLRLGEEGLGVGVGGEGRHLEAPGMCPDHFEGLGADRARRAENRDGHRLGGVPEDVAAVVEGVVHQSSVRARSRLG